MQKKLLVIALGTLFAMPALAADAPAAAPASPHTFTSNVALVSDYLYRGISQTNAQPAIQGGFDYAHSSGLYAGAWGSSISWLKDSGSYSTKSSQLELDTYFGYKNSFATDYSYDVGFLRYNYPAKYFPGAIKADTDEIYGQIGWKWLTAKYSYSLGDTFATPDAKGTGYFDLSANYPVGDTGITLGAHYGKQSYKGSSLDSNSKMNPNSRFTYNDYKVSVTKDISGYVLGLAYSNTNAKSAYDGSNVYKNDHDTFEGKSTAVVSLARTF